MNQSASPSVGAASNATLIAVGLMFFTNGAVYANWIARLPEVQTRTGLSLGGVGVLLAAAGVTGTLASVGAGGVVDRVGSRRVTITAGIALVLMFPIIGTTTSPWVLGGVLMLIALGDTFTDIGMNIQAAQIDDARPKPVINRIHGVWSIGTLAGGLLASALAEAGVALWIHLSLAAVVLLGVVLFASRSLLTEDVPDEASTATPVAARGGVALTLVMLLAVGWMAIVIEIVPAEWSTLRLSRDLLTSPGTAGLGFVAFVSGMVVGRMTGDQAMHVLGVRPVMLAGLVLSLAGSLFAALVDATPAVFAGFAIAGLGTSVVYPQLYVRVTRVPGMSAGRGLGFMSTGMRFGVLVTPIATGALADRFDVGTAIAIVVAIAAVILVPAIVRLLQITR